MTAHTILITGTSSGMGERMAYALAQRGHHVFASMRGIAGKNAARADAARHFAAAESVDLRPLEMDVLDEASVAAAVSDVVRERGGIDVLIHNAGHMVTGPAEAFTTEQCAAMYDVNVLGTQRLNRAALPVMRAAGRGLVVWIGSTSTRGGTPPYLAPYFAAKAAMEAFAVSYAAELAPWGIETSIVVPGIYVSGTNHFAHAERPADEAVLRDYAGGPTRDIPERIRAGQQGVVPVDADVGEVARAVVRVVEAPFGERPFRVTVDPVDGGSDVVSMVADRVRSEMFRRIGMGDLLKPAMR
jgi:NAD(P)-dependent dehydrogenase (short-subunit alcohol dehydrogenase family)